VTGRMFWFASTTRVLAAETVPAGDMAVASLTWAVWAALAVPAAALAPVAPAAPAAAAGELPGTIASAAPVSTARAVPPMVMSLPRLER
jgi:fructose-1-phosphate kinase PfkB-like protein